MEGYLTKQGQVVKNWKKRWFCLRANDVNLSYYRKQEDVLPLGNIYLTGCIIEECSQKTKKLHSFCIKPYGKERVYYLVADSDSMRDKWMSVIQEASNNVNKKLRFSKNSFMRESQTELTTSSPSTSSSQYLITQQQFLHQQQQAQQQLQQQSQQFQVEPQQRVEVEPQPIQIQPQQLPNPQPQNTEQKINLTSQYQPLLPYGTSPSPYRSSLQIIPMSKEKLDELLSELNGTDFSSARDDILRSVAAKYTFVCSQLAEIVKKISFSDGRVNALRILAPKVLDPQNVNLILEQLMFESERVLVKSFFSS